ncbi:TetR/AcrR family transcriptional regulator [Cellulomonas sp. Leaf334]|uniref:TetR/AcrR family transcriptional regulator n=1 Tax=Cellulomonas sp. Leaf334 TaxID=1736339 RepID=UPI000700F5C9|nr:TetR/AcrR family transcriptional regulator [Cellulomonas sp. Leaf334]KQR17223.1 hypothetical protein ASF78_07960 [Cellulomonas sp. Leaf334]
MPVAKGARIDPAETRQRLLDTADRLFAGHSIHAVGVNEIAAEAGASKLSLYRYFSSKHDLAASVVGQRSERIHDWLRRETADAPGGADRVLSVFDLLMEWYAQPGYRGCTIVNAVTDARGDGELELGEIGRLHLQRYRELLRSRAIEAGVKADRANRLSRQLLLLIEGATTVAFLEGDRSTAGADARAAAAAMLDDALGINS